ncbi:hypothetical protein Hypma_011874 [Hypsizygus marmoreus]|uniref:Uncharacterized protein n=1 Tax=Hypsizygus marmoreus TaxID=39966 RepID=A0A369JJQ2_HYPMA|nr:hypothetical protein Hypma_011874 [Hypsizygus marmoreus]
MLLYALHGLVKYNPRLKSFPLQPTPDTNIPYSLSFFHIPPRFLLRPQKCFQRINHPPRWHAQRSIRVIIRQCYTPPHLAIHNNAYPARMPEYLCAARDVDESADHGFAAFVDVGVGAVAFGYAVLEECVVVDEVAPDFWDGHVYLEMG